MAKKKSGSKKVNKISKQKRSGKTHLLEEIIENGKPIKPKFNLPFSLSKKSVVIIGLILAAVVIWRFKGYFIVGSVNGQLITRFELKDQLFRRFGSQTLEGMINEKLLLVETRKKGIFITS